MSSASSASRGHEENGEPNLIWTCRACNTRLGVVFKRLGLGRRTRQYNPEAKGAGGLGQWLTAVLSAKGESDQITAPAAVEMIRPTPPGQDIAARQPDMGQRAHGTNRSEDPPF